MQKQSWHKDISSCDVEKIPSVIGLTWCLTANRAYKKIKKKSRVRRRDRRPSSPHTSLKYLHSSLPLIVQPFAHTILRTDWFLQPCGRGCVSSGECRGDDNSKGDFCGPECVIKVCRFFLVSCIHSYVVQ